MNISCPLAKIDDIHKNLLDRTLVPYKYHCKYLRSAQFQYPHRSNLLEQSKHKKQGLWFVKGEFSIPESCYIEDTGHFNSVEFNICYNQLGYLMMAYLFEQNLLEGLEAMNGWDLDVYGQRQLPNFLIVKFASTFKKPIDSRFFYGTISMNHYSVRSQMIMAKTSCAFHDDQGGWAEGEVTIAILNGDTEKASVRHREPAIAGHAR